MEREKILLCLFNDASVVSTDTNAGAVVLFCFSFEGFSVWGGL